MKAVALVSVWVFLVIAATLLGSPVHAKEVRAWSDPAIDALRDVPSHVDVASHCPTYIQEMFIPDRGKNEKVCIFGDARMRFGTFYDQAGRRATVFSKPFDAEMHTLQGVCGTYDCQYSAATDVLVTHQAIGWATEGLVIYKNISKRIVISKDSAGRVIYTLSLDAPDYELRIPNKEFISSPQFTLSSNGEWLALELREKGVALLKTDDFTVRQISSKGFPYGYGQDPLMELAVSNDGKSVVVTGSHVGFSVLDITPGCGQSLRSGLTFDADTQVCPSTDLNISQRFYPLALVQRPQFIADDSRIEVVVGIWGKPDRLVTFGAGYMGIESPLDYIALGDSFVSGEGEVQRSFYFDAANTCHISRRSYPYLVGAIAWLPSTRVGSVACAGARIGDITGSSAQYRGQGGRDVPANTVEVRREQVLSNLTPGSLLQSAFVDRYQPKAITIGIGGNDAGLMGKLRVCAMPGTCEWAVGDGLRASAAEIRRLFDKLVLLYADMHRMSSATRLFAIGYPNIMHQDGVCDPVTSLLFDRTERTYMRESIQYLNRVIESAAQRAGIGYIDIEDSLSGSELCSGQPVAAMNGLRLGDDTALFTSLPDLKLIGSESFHPTPTGHAMIAAAFTSKHYDITDEDYCGDGQTTCPTSAVIPEPSQYWSPGPGGATGVVVESYAQTFAYTSPETTPMLHISVEEGVLHKDSTVRVEIRSHAAVLGTLRANNRGVVDGIVTLPDTIEEGEHTLHLFGTSEDGTAVDLYQFVHVAQSASGLQTMEMTTGGVLPPQRGAHDTGVADESHSDIDVAMKGGVLGQNIVSALNAGTPKIAKQLGDMVRYQGDVANTVSPWLMAGVGVPLVILAILLILRWAKPSG